MSKEGHPLPASDEARHNEIPESLEQGKGRGDDSRPVVQPDEAVNPAGERYRYDDLGRGPGTVSVRHKEEQERPAGREHEAAEGEASHTDGSSASRDDLSLDQAGHQDRGQSVAEEQTEDR